MQRTVMVADFHADHTAGGKTVLENINFSE